MKNKKAIKLYCGWTPPILFLINYGIGFVLFVVSLLLFFSLIILFTNSRMKEEKVLNKYFLKNLLWLTTFVVYIVSFYIFNNEINYILSLLILSILLLVNLGIGKKYNLYKVRKIYWILFVIFFIFSLTMTSLKIPEVYSDIKKQIKITKERIENKNRFKKIIKDLPEYTTFKSNDIGSYYITYAIPDDMKNVFEYYKNNISEDIWDKYLYEENTKEKEENSSAADLLWPIKKGDDKSIYLRNSQSNVWLKLYFVEHRDNYSYFSIIITSGKCPGADKCLKTIYPPYDNQEFLGLGGCGESNTWY